MKISDETKVGILAAFGLAIMIIGYSFLKGNNIFAKNFTLYAIYDHVDGLNPADLIKINGLAVGRVDKLSLLTKGSGKILAELHLNKGVVIPKNSVAKIESSDLLGTKQVSLVFDTPGPPAKDGDTLLTDVQKSLQQSVEMEILPVKKKAEDMMASIDSVVQVIQALLKGGKVESSLDNLSHATGSFARLAGNVDTLIYRERSTIKGILDNLDGITGNINKSNGQITGILSNMSTFTDSLSKVSIVATVRSMDSTLTQLDDVLKKVNQGQGTASKLINDQALYNNLTHASASLDSLLVDVKVHPGRYVHLSFFGGKKYKDAQ